MEETFERMTERHGKTEVISKRPMISRATPTINKTGVRNGWGRQVLKIQFVSQATAKTARPPARPDSKATQANKKSSMLTPSSLLFPCSETMTRRPVGLTGVTAVL